MSNWSHVAGVIRVDNFRLDSDIKRDWDKEIGKECLFHSPEKLWEEVEANPNNFLPMGSEGSLQKSVWENPDVSHLAAYTITIFGDLRDHDNPQAIVNWFREKCKKLNVVRQACITVYNECNGVVTWTYEGED